jgi:hypothetical protein
MAETREKPDIEITPEMIEAGVTALLRAGVGDEPGESMEIIRAAVRDVLFAAIEVCPHGRNLDT